MTTTFDFHVEIGARGPYGYDVRLRAPDGAATAVTMQFPLPERELEYLLSRIPDAILASSASVRRSISMEERPLQRLGRLLFDALFTGGGRALLADSRNRVVHSDQQLRIVLEVGPPELARLPWEFLFDPVQDGYVGLTTPLVRRPLVPYPQRPLPVAPPLRILCMVARPSDQRRLATHKEQRRLYDTLTGLRNRGQVEIGWTAGETWRDLHAALRTRPDPTVGAGPSGPWHVLHFIGHGGFDVRTQEGTLALTGEHGGTYHLGAENLAMVLHQHPSLRLVVLNACDTGRSSALDPFSSVAAALMRAGVPAVLAMQYEISDPAAIEFSRAFYEGLADQLTVDDAVTQARQAIRLATPGTLEWGTPVLYMRSSDGRLFDLTGAPRARSEERPREPTAGQTMGPGPGGPPGHAATAMAPSRLNPSILGKIKVPALVTAATFSPDGGLLGLSCSAQVAVLVDGNGQEYRRMRHDGTFAYVRDIAFAPDGARFATASGDGTTRIWDTATGNERIRVKPANGLVVSGVVFSPDGARFATSSYDGAARIWDAATAQEQLTIRLSKWADVVFKDARAHDVEFAPDGNRLGIAYGKRAFIWDLQTDNELITVMHDNTVNRLAISPDGAVLATAGNDQTAGIWDAGSGRQLLRIRHEGPVLAVAFSPDGSMLATACKDGSARIWDFHVGRELCKITLTRQVNAIAFSPDGTRIATAGGEKTVQLWYLGREHG